MHPGPILPFLLISETNRLFIASKLIPLSYNSEHAKKSVSSVHKMAGQDTKWRVKKTPFLQHVFGQSHGTI